MDRRKQRLAFEATLGIPFTSGNRIDVLKNGEQIFPAMLDAIRSAEASILFLTFIYWRGDIARRFATALAERAESGVKVRVLLDSFGAASMPDDLVDLMEKAGVDVEWFRPLARWKVWDADNRTHRKVLVVDGAVAFTGGVGIAEEWEGDARHPGEWRDTHFRIRGPAVHGLRAAFLGNWVETGRRIDDGLMDLTDCPPAGDAAIQVVRGTAAIGWSDVATLLQTVIAVAERSIRIVTPYFAPDETTTEMLGEAAARGVDIEIIIPGPHTDKRVSEFAGSECFAPLMEAGVRIWAYQPTMIHAKVILLDGALACVGSANINHRSMLKDDEVVLVIDCPDTVAELGRDFDADVRRCEAFDLRQWKRRGFIRRAVEAVASLVKPQV